MADQHESRERSADPDHAGTSAPRQTTAGPDRFGTNGLLVVGFAAAVLSFQTWVEVAKSVGFTAHWSISLGSVAVSIWIAWLYPVAIDAYAWIVTREWLRSDHGSELRKWAKANSIGAIILAFSGQAAYHAFGGKAGTGPQWTIFVIAMGGMPPLVVGLAVHLYTKRGLDRADRQSAEDQPGAQPMVRTVDVQPAEITVRPNVSAPNPAPRPTARTNGVVRALRSVRTTEDLRTATAETTVTPAIAALADQLDNHFPDRIPTYDDGMAATQTSSRGQIGKAVQELKRRRETKTTSDERSRLSKARSPRPDEGVPSDQPETPPVRRPASTPRAADDLAATSEAALPAHRLISTH